MKKLFILMLFVFLLVGTVAAADWDNVKSYDSLTKTVTIDNAFGLPLIGSTLLTAKLDTPQTYFVHAGYNKVAEFTLNPKTDLSSVVKSLEFYDLNKGGTKINKWVDVKYLANVSYPVDDYSCLKTILKNGTVQDSCSVSGSHLEYKEDWIPFDGSVTKDSLIQIGLFTNVDWGEHVEWIPTIAGIKITEWADWQNLVVNYSNYQVFNTTGSDNFTVPVGVSSVAVLIVGGGGAGGWVEGNSVRFGGGGGAGEVIYNNSYVVTPGANVSVVVGAGGISTSEATSPKNGSQSSFGSLIAVPGGGGGAGGPTASVNSFGARGGSGGGGGLLDTTGAGNGGVGNATFYGNNGANGDDTSNFGGGGGGALTGGSSANGGSGVQIWNLTWGSGGNGASGSGNAEGTGGSNSTGSGGSGAIRTSSGGPFPGGLGGTGVVIVAWNTGLNVNLVSPSNQQNFTTNYVNFTGNVTPQVPSTLSIVNVSLVINGTINQTNSSGIEGIYNFNNTFFGDDFYNWSIIAWGNDSKQYNASEGTFVFSVDAVPPQMSILSPTGNYPYLINGANTTLNVSINDSHLSTCWYSYNSSNITFPCTTATTSTGYFNLTNTSSITVWANDTLGNTNSVSGNWTFDVFDLNQYVYNSSVTEGTVTGITGLFQTGTALSSSYLEYNNTNNTGSASTISTLIYNVTGTSTVPVVVADTNVSWFFWINGINTTSYNQTVTSISLDTCSANTILLFNFTLYDEEKPTTKLSNTTIDYSFNIYDYTRTSLIVSANGTSQSNSQAFCLNASITNSTTQPSLDGRLLYYANTTDTSYATRYYNFLNYSLNDGSVGRNISLYDINSSKSLPFQLTFRDSSSALNPNIIVSVDKQYLPTNDYKTVEKPITDTNGETILNLIRNTAIYNLIMTNISGGVVASFSNIVAFCQDYTIGSCAIELTAPGTGETTYNYSTDAGITYGVSYSNSTKLITLSFNSINSSSIPVRLRVQTENQFENQTICDSTVTLSTGTLTCNVSNSLGSNQYFFANIYTNGNLIDNVLVNANPSNPNLGGSLGVNGFFFAVLLMLFIILIFADDKEILVIGLALGWVVIITLGLIKGVVLGTETIGASTVAGGGVWLIITIMIFLWKLREDKG